MSHSSSSQRKSLSKTSGGTWRLSIVSFSFLLLPALPAGSPGTTVTITAMPNPTQQYIITLDGVAAVTTTSVSFSTLPFSFLYCVCIKFANSSSIARMESGSKHRWERWVRHMKKPLGIFHRFLVLRLELESSCDFRTSVSIPASPPPSSSALSFLSLRYDHTYILDHKRSRFTHDTLWTFSFDGYLRLSPEAEHFRSLYLGHFRLSSTINVGLWSAFDH